MCCRSAGIVTSCVNIAKVAEFLQTRFRIDLKSAVKPPKDSSLSQTDWRNCKWSAKTEQRVKIPTFTEDPSKEACVRLVMSDEALGLDEAGHGEVQGAPSGNCRNTHYPRCVPSGYRIRWGQGLPFEESAASFVRHSSRRYHISSPETATDM